MLPESMAPQLPGYDSFKEFMEGRGVKVRREYMPETPRRHGPETREYGDDYEGHPLGEFHPSYWQIVIYREELRPDGRVHIYCLTIHDQVVSLGQEIWEHEVELVNTGWERYLEMAEM